MSFFVAGHCSQCKEYQSITLIENNRNLQKQDLLCPLCRAKWGAVERADDFFKRCPVCPASQFYTVKDFNQLLGIGIVVVAAILVPFTYGLSLPVLALIDWLLYKRAKEFIVCYRCGSEFKGMSTDKRFKSFLHHIGLKYDKYR